MKSWGFHLPSGSQAWWVFAEGAGGRTAVVVYDGDGDLTHIPPYALDNFRPPLGDGRLVVVYGPISGSNHDIDVGVKLTACQYYERWASLRGAE